MGANNLFERKLKQIYKSNGTSRISNGLNLISDSTNCFIIIKSSLLYVFINMKYDIFNIGIRAQLEIFFILCLYVSFSTMRGR